MKLKYWIEAMRLRTLPVSIAGVVAAWGYAAIYNTVKPLPLLLCLIFAILAQIASNFANEYYDYRDGLDRPGRQGPRRGVTEGDITPRSMKRATYATLAIDALIGLSLIYYGGWWLLLAGVFIILGALSYSTGPYPLSRHALGEVAVILFFGIVPVTLSFYVQSLEINATVLTGSLAIGLMGANILIVNNYRDSEEDRAVGKTTLANILPAGRVLLLYILNAVAAVALMWPVWLSMPRSTLIIPATYLLITLLLWHKMRQLKGAPLNPMLGITAIVMFLYSFSFAMACIITHE